MKTDLLLMRIVLIAKPVKSFFRIGERRSEAILGHLCLITDDERYPEALRQCASQLLETWSNYIELAKLPAGKHGLH